MSTFYQINLGVFAAASTYLLYRQYQAGENKKVDVPLQAQTEVRTEEDADEACPVSSFPSLSSPLEEGRYGSGDAASVSQFKRDFLVVYALAVAADWLQGPHIYAIYKYEKHIEEQWVAALYAAGFVAGAVSASFAGQLADRYGRRLACLVYCGGYALTCLSMASDRFGVLLAGRLCGGVSTTLLFSVFEAWMITEYHRRGLDDPGCGLPLGSVFASMTTLSCLVAIASGVVGDMLVGTLGGRIWPFVASIVCTGATALLMLRNWRENYGAKPTSQDVFSDLRAGIADILANRRVLALGLSSCFFEGAMYLFIFFWSAALNAARARTGSKEELPYGLIFSSFMCAMMAGSALFSLSTPRHTPESASFLLMAATLVVSAAFSTAVVVENEHVLFWALCVIEAAIGVYFPSMSFLKSEAVEDGVRGRVYSILRFPLNVFVVVVHSLDAEGDAHRNHVFLMLAALLMLSFFFVKHNFGPR